MKICSIIITIQSFFFVHPLTSTEFQYLVRIKTSKTNPFNIMGRILLKFVNFYDDQKSDAHFNQK